MSTVLLSALITVLAGLKGGSLTDATKSNIVLALGALTTIVSAWNALFSPRESWHLNSETYGRLRSLQDRLEFQSRHTDFAQAADEFLAKAFEEYQAIVAAHNEKWQKLRQKSS